jgi:hypothetical protein
VTKAQLLTELIKEECTLAEACLAFAASYFATAPNEEQMLAQRDALEGAFDKFQAAHDMWFDADDSEDEPPPRAL